MLLLSPWMAWAQAEPDDTARPAAFLYNLPAFVEWPSGPVHRPRELIVVGVLGSEPVALGLERLASGRTAAAHPVGVRRLQDGEPLGGVHVLFIGATTPQRMADAVAAAQGPVLVVTEQPGGLQAGAVLNLMPEPGRLRFSASLPAADARGVRLSARLLALASSVEGRGR